MNNNDILRRIRYTLDLSDPKVVYIFGLAGHSIPRIQVSRWLKREDDPDFDKCKDLDLAIFLNGLIVDLRGKKEGPRPEPEKILNNNAVFMKLKIALNLKAEDVVEILMLANVAISKHELSAFFRRPGHKHFRECKNQMLRNFLRGLQLKYRPGSDPIPENPWKIPNR